MKKLKIATIVGTRPEIIRLSCVIKKLEIYFEHFLIHTGQNYDYELNDVFFDDLNIKKPDFFLNAAGNSSAETIGNVIIKVDKVFRKINPDAVLVLGDTNSCMSILSAKRLKIPTFHMEAGNRCFDLRVPEEINRKLIDHTADVNLTYSSISREYLLREGLSPDLIIKTGSPMFEVLKTYYKDIQKANVLKRLGLKKNEFFVISAHREENIDNKKNFSNFIDSLNTIATHYELPIIVSTHPRTQKQINRHDIVLNPLVKLSKPLSFTDYNKLQISAKAVLSDSGTISEEASILNFPAINIRENHERPEGFEETVTIMTGLEKTRIMQALAVVENQPRGDDRLLRQVSDYSMPNVSDKIVRIIISYTDYVNRIVWKKY